MSVRTPARHLGLRRTAALAAATAVFLGVTAAGVSAADPTPKADLLFARGVEHGASHSPSRPQASPNLTFHGGTILTSTVVQAIFWGKGWSSPADKITGIDAFYTGVGGTPYLHSNTEYTGTNGTVGTGVTYQGSIVDTSTSLTKAPSTTTIQAEVNKLISNPVPNGYYPVYVDLKRGSARYCAWHSYGYVGDVPVQFGFFFNLDGDPGCDPADPASVHSQGLEAIANVSGHELSETVTDPRNGGWLDSSGEENADKCAWTFSGTVAIGSQQWKIQGNWSNVAYNAKSGYDHAGCIETSK